MPPLNTGLPDWVRGASQLGVPALIALGLVYWLTIRIDTSQARIEHMLQIQAAFAYATCLNAATNDLAMARCAVAIDGTLQR